MIRNKTLLFLLLFQLVCCMSCAQSLPDRVVFVPIGDSYTIGTRVSEQERWPNQLCKMLEAEGIHLELAANPAHVGWTTRDALSQEMDVLRKYKPPFCTLLIGVNDWVQGYNETAFRDNLEELMDTMREIVGPEGKLLVITIPDFSVTPAGAQFGDVKEISQGIARFNAIIMEEAGERGLPVADIYPTSQRIADDPATVASDGLHPSGKAYAEWLKVIAPAVKEVLKAR